MILYLLNSSSIPCNKFSAPFINLSFAVNNAFYGFDFKEVRTRNSISGNKG